MVYGEPLFSLIQCNTQYFGKLFRYFNQVLCDFGPHQTIPVLKYLSPSPPSTKVIWLLLKPFERSNGRWMSLAPFLMVLLMELADSPGWLSCPFRSFHRIGSRPVFFPHRVTVIGHKGKQM